MDHVQRLSRETIASLGELPLIAVDPSQLLTQVIAILQAQHSGCALVVDQGRAVGIITERDILRRLGSSQPLTVPVGEAMSRELWPVRLDETIGKALRIMRDRQCRHLAVLDGDRPVGILPVQRIIRSLVEFMPQAVYNLPPDAARVATARDGA